MRKTWYNVELSGILYLAAALMFAPVPASAHGYYRHYGYRADPGPAIALGLFGAFAGAAIASQYGYYPYTYAPPVYYYQPACNPGFYWTGDTCWPY
jgi:hypothetical protein